MFELSDYPYLLFSLILFSLLFLATWYCTSYRKTIVLSAILSVPASFATLLFVPDYWQPVRLGDGPVGLEDFLFSYSTGGLVWFFALVIAGYRFNFQFKLRNIIIRYASLLLLGVSLLYTTRHLGVGIMNECLIGIGLAGLILIALKPSTWMLSLAGGLSFGLLYALCIIAVLMVFPHFSGQWNHEHLWGIQVLNVPLEEFAWATAFGFVWPLAMAYVFEGRKKSLS